MLQIIQFCSNDIWTFFDDIKWHFWTIIALSFFFWDLVSKREKMTTISFPLLNCALEMKILSCLCDWYRFQYYEEVGENSNDWRVRRRIRVCRYQWWVQHILTHLAHSFCKTSIIIYFLLKGIRIDLGRVMYKFRVTISKSGSSPPKTRSLHVGRRLSHRCFNHTYY